MAASTDRQSFRRAVAGVPRFCYRNGLALVVVSVCWFLASVPLVTIGPATLAAYAAIQDLRSDRNRIDRGRVWRTLRRNGAASAAFSGVPVAFGAVALVYGVTALERGSILGEAIALVAGYAALYLALALIPTFDGLARGDDPVAAFRFGLTWLARHPTPALTMGLVTVVVLALTALLTIGFVLLFAGVAFSVQLAILDAVE